MKTIGLDSGTCNSKEGSATLEARRSRGCALCAICCVRCTGLTFSSTSGSRLPMKRLAPTSSCFLSDAALLTRIGLPKNLIMFSILMACVQKPALCILVAREQLYICVGADGALALREERSYDCAGLRAACARQTAHWRTHVVCVVFTPQLHKAIPLMCTCDTILGHIDIHCKAQRRGRRCCGRPQGYCRASASPFFALLTHQQGLPV